MMRWLWYLPLAPLQLCSAISTEKPRGSTAETQHVTVDSRGNDQKWDAFFSQAEVVKWNHTMRKEDSPVAHKWGSSFSLKRSHSCGHFLTHDKTDWGGGWQNDYDAEHTMYCPAQEAVVSILSHHSNGAEDRRWNVLCRPLKGTGASIGTCRDTGWTAYDGAWNQGATDTLEVLTGVRSIHSNGAEDRKFTFRFCKLAGVTRHHQWADADWKNSYDQELKVEVDEKSFFHTLALYP